MIQKTIITITVFSAIFLALWSMLSIKEEILDAVRNIEKKVEIHDIKFYGYRNKKLAFKARALTGWTGNDIEEAYLNNIVDGEVYNDKGQLVLKQLKAKKIYSNSRYETLSAEEGISAIFISNSKQDKQPLSIFIEAENLRYDSKTKITLIQKDVKILKKDTEITAQRAEIQNENNIVNIQNQITLTNADLILTANRMTTYLDSDTTTVTGGATMVWLPEPTANMDDSRKTAIRSKRTIAFCDEVIYTNKKNQEMTTLNGHVVIKQPDKNLSGESAFYNGLLDQFFVSTNVKADLNSMDWLLKEDTRKQLKDQDIRESLTIKTNLTGDQLLYDRKTKNLIISGNVFVDQPKNEAMADRAYYLDKDDLLTLGGNIKIRKKGEDWISADSASMFLGKQVFEASGRVETEFKLKKKK